MRHLTAGMTVPEVPPLSRLRQVRHVPSLAAIPVAACFVLITVHSSAVAGQNPHATTAAVQAATASANETKQPSAPKITGVKLVRLERLPGNIARFRLLITGENFPLCETREIHA